MADTLALIGVGLIGGSLARALRHHGLVERIIGVGRQAENLVHAKELGVIDTWTHDIAAAVHDADVVCVAVPMKSYPAIFTTMAPALQEHTIVFDVGSTKAYAVDMAHQCLPYPERFVPAHPIAGTEASGVEASFSSLFENHLCVLTPEEHTHADALNKVEKYWLAAGSHLMRMDARQHDAFLAGVSHLPHVAAFALVYAIHQGEHETHDPFAFAAGGFRDFTRIASSSPEMWRDIALCNRKALLDKMEDFQMTLSDIATALKNDDGDRLLQVFTEAKNVRENWIHKHGGSL